jgi:copper chaperone
MSRLRLGGEGEIVVSMGQSLNLLTMERSRVLHRFHTWLDSPTMVRFTLPFFPVNQGITMNQTFTVTGMTCGHCEKAVTRALQQVDPQAQVVIDRAQNQVQVESTQAREALAQAIAEEGYAVAN